MDPPVRLDAAFGRGSNAELIAAVIAELDVNVQLSGGIRDDASLDRALSTGCARVNLGTPALEDPAWCERVIAAHGERVAVGLEVRSVENPDGSTEYRLRGRGWTRDGANLEGAVVGKALYAGRFTLPDALEATRQFDDASRRRRGA